MPIGSESLRFNKSQQNNSQEGMYMHGNVLRKDHSISKETIFTTSDYKCNYVNEFFF